MRDQDNNILVFPGAGVEPPSDTEPPEDQINLHDAATLEQIAKDTAALDCFKRAESDRLRELVIIGTLPDGTFSIDTSLPYLKDVVYELHRAIIEVNDQIRNLEGRVG